MQSCAASMLWRPLCSGSLFALEEGCLLGRRPYYYSAGGLSALDDVVVLISASLPAQILLLLLSLEILVRSSS